MFLKSLKVTGSAEISHLHDLVPLISAHCRVVLTEPCELVSVNYRIVTVLVIMPSWLQVRSSGSLINPAHITAKFHTIG